MKMEEEYTKFSPTEIFKVEEQIHAVNKFAGTLYFWDVEK